jgi:hypothetical protein
VFYINNRKLTIPDGMQDDLYSLLGLKVGCTRDDIKQGYRKMAKLYHPDLNKSARASEMMTRINAAYATLSDVEKREMYDQQVYAGMAREGTRRSGPKVESEEPRFTRASSWGPQPQYGYAWDYGYTGVNAPSRNRIKMYAIFLAIFVLSCSYLFVLPFVYEADGAGIITSFSDMGQSALAGITATASPWPSMSPSPTATQASVSLSPDNAHVRSMAPPMTFYYGKGIVTGWATLAGETLIPGNSYIAICDADNMALEYYSTVSGPTGYFRFAAVNNTVGKDGSPEKRYVMYAQNNKTKSEAFSKPFSVEPYRITSVDIELAAAK